MDDSRNQKNEVFVVFFLTQEFTGDPIFLYFHLFFYLFFLRRLAAIKIIKARLQPRFFHFLKKSKKKNTAAYLTGTPFA